MNRQEYNIFLLWTLHKILYNLHPWDVNSDGTIDILDLVLVAQHFGESPPTESRADVNNDGEVDISDLVLVGSHLEEKAVLH